MSLAGTPSSDPWVIVSRERMRYEEQFRQLKPVNGIVTGDQAKTFLLQSQLPPLVLGQIWALADTDSDGKMNIDEFSIACKLINLKLRGFDIPQVLPPNLLASLRMHSVPPAIPPLPATMPQKVPAAAVPAVVPPVPIIPGYGVQPAYVAPVVPGAPMIPGMSPTSQLPLTTGVPPALPPSMVSAAVAPPAPVAGTVIPPVQSVAPIPSVGPSATSTPRASITSMGSLDRSGSMDNFGSEWSVPHQTKLKYTQIFNTTDRQRTGFLSGVQARNVMVQTKLSQNILAQIWALSDMDSDGRLGCEEFVLAMHLCEQASQGIQPPSPLPADLIPPSFRRGVRTASISSQGNGQIEQDPASTLITTTFEDKRKENFEKGQAELERRRKTLLEQQRKEAEERERKEREEQDRKEKARQEAERRRMEELDKQMREQQEQERLKEEERKRLAEQREAARREMERQRQLEWEKQRSQELQQQRQREQESVLKLKAKNQCLTIELSSLNDQVKELSQKICDTRLGVSNVKTTIDGMRSTRDSQMQDMSQLKNKLKEQNARLLALSQEKVKLEAKNKLNAQINKQPADKQAFDNKEINIKNLKEKVEDLQSQIDGKMSDITNNNSQLDDLKTQLKGLVGECENLYSVYEQKRNTVLDMKKSSNNRSVDYGSTWKDTDEWGAETNSSWPVDNWATTTAATQPPATTAVPATRYRALYEFVGRNNDEISFQPGDIINVPLEQTGEPGWLAGEVRGKTGWFPESYVEPADDADVRRNSDTNAPVAEPVQQLAADDTETKRLEGIVEIPEAPTEPPPEEQPAAAEVVETVLEECIASYPYQSVEQGDLSFNAGDIIMVVKKEGDWWTGRLGSSIGIFPSNYVQKYDPNAVSSPPVPAPVAPNPPAEVTANAIPDTTSQMDNEVSQITESKLAEAFKSPDYGSGIQTIKGSKKPDIASVIAPYQATSTEQLSLQRGQLIMIRKKTDSGWWEGELQAKGRKRQVGWFPASYVKILNSSGRASGRTTPVSTTRMQQEVVIDKVVALYPYTAANPDELSFLKDDIISVTAREEPSWWRGELNGVSGVFPSNYVTPLQQSVTPDHDNKKRKDCVKELIHTEKAYIDDMAVVHEVFELPLRKSSIIAQDEIDGIFVNWQDILQCNRNFHSDLMNRLNSGSDIIGDIICSHLPRMTAYITFCSKQLESAALLQKLTENSVAFREMVKKCQSHRSTKGMPLSSFLIKPMQRITRYPLLISKILDNTSESREDHAYLVEALQIADRFLKRLNENVRLKENEERLQWIQTNVQQADLGIMFNSNTNKLGPRKLLHHGMLTKVKSGKELIGFLFNDFLMFVQPSKSLGTVQFNFQRNNNLFYKIYKQPIVIQDLVAARGSTENVESGTDSNRVLKVQDKRHVISVLASSVNECNLWLKRIEAAQEISGKITSLCKVRPKSRPQMGASCGRLLVLVQKGTRFISAVHSSARALLLVVLVEGEEIYAKAGYCGSARTLRRKGKSHGDNIYCKVILGDQEQHTDIGKDNLINGNTPQNGAPQVPMLVWNYSMQFLIRNINEDALTITVFEMCPFQPDEFLGRAEVKVLDIYHETQNTKGPITKKLILHQVESGELTIKLDMQLFSNNY